MADAAGREAVDPRADFCERPHPTSASIAADILLAERYRLVEPVPDRGMGETWRVLDQRRKDAPLSMKFLRAVDGDEIPERALAAIHALKSLRHGAVPTVLNHGIHAGRPWVVFDDLRGESLGTQLDHARARGDTLDLALLRWVFDSVAGATQAAHTAQLPLTHGTLTPGSVIVLSKPVRGMPCALLDLGLMAWLPPPTDASARSARLLVVRAPEVVSGAEATVATDVFALGALLMEMFALPASAGATLAAVTDERRRPDVPASVWKVLFTAMASAPAQRFQSVAALTAALEAAWKDPASSPRATTSPSAPSAASQDLLSGTVAPVSAGPSLTPSGPIRTPTAPVPLDPMPVAPSASFAALVAPVASHATPASQEPVRAGAEPSEPNPWSTGVLQREVPVARPVFHGGPVPAPAPSPNAASDMDRTFVDPGSHSPEYDDDQATSMAARMHPNAAPVATMMMGTIEPVQRGHASPPLDGMNQTLLAASPSPSPSPPWSPPPFSPPPPSLPAPRPFSPPLAQVPPGRITTEASTATRAPASAIALAIAMVLAALGVLVVVLLRKG